MLNAQRSTVTTYTHSTPRQLRNDNTKRVFAWLIIVLEPRSIAAV